MSIRPLSPELQERARLELNEDPARVQDDIQHIKDWIAKQPHLRANTDDQWVLSFLRGCKFSLERTKEKIDLYCTLHTTAPELFSMKHTDPKFHEIINLGGIVVLPKPAQDGSLISLIKPGVYNPDQYSMLDTLAASSIINKVLQMDNDNAVVCGIRTVLDLDGVTMGHFLQMTSHNVKKMVAFGQDASPFRMKGAHYLNTPTGFETVFNLIKGFLNEKNKNRLYVHNKNYEELYEYVLKDVLPAEYGGSAGTIEEINDHWLKKIEQYKSFLEQDSHNGTDESKRPGKPKTSEEMFGLEGSFRQLQFD